MGGPHVGEKMGVIFRTRVYCIFHFPNFPKSKNFPKLPDFPHPPLDVEGFRPIPTTGAYGQLPLSGGIFKLRIAAIRTSVQIVVILGGSFLNIHFANEICHFGILSILSKLRFHATSNMQAPCHSKKNRNSLYFKGLALASPKRVVRHFATKCSILP